MLTVKVEPLEGFIKVVLEFYGGGNSNSCGIQEKIMGVIGKSCR